MKAIVVRETGEAEVLELQEVSEPKMQEDEVVMKVEGTARNQADTERRKALCSTTRGCQSVSRACMLWDHQAVGKNVSRWKIGDQVCALLAGGGYAEKVAVQLGKYFPFHLVFP